MDHAEVQTDPADGHETVQCPFQRDQPVLAEKVQGKSFTCSDIKGDTSLVTKKLKKWTEDVEALGIEAVRQREDRADPEPRENSIERESSYKEERKVLPPLIPSVPKLSEQASDARAFGGEALIPVTVIERFGRKDFEDFFLWNVYETSVTPEAFVAALVSDNDLPSVLEGRILASVKKQLVYWGFGKRLVLPEDIKAEDIERGVVKLDLKVRMDNLEYRDILFWNPHDTNNSPEVFSTSLCTDLGLTGEWALRISHSIRLQLLRHILAIYRRHPSPFQQIRPELLPSPYITPSESCGLFSVEDG